VLNVLGESLLSIEDLDEPT
jgi:hypothetical protein